MAWLAGYEIPTEAPVVVQHWVVPMDETAVGVEELLPSSVVIQEGNFAIDVSPASVSASLNELCGECGPLDGITTDSLPPFEGQI